jgi:chaperonin GroES
VDIQRADRLLRGFGGFKYPLEYPTSGSVVKTPEMMKMSVGIEPLAAMVLLELEKAPETTAGGLLLPEEAREKMNVGRVLSVGPDAEHVAEGDRVIYRNYAGTTIEWLGIEYLLIKEEDLQAKVTN